MRARAAPRARMSVVSNSGTPVSAGCTRNPIAVQPRMTPCAPRGEAVDDAEELGARVVTNLAQTELIEDRAAHERCPFSSGVSALRP